MSSIMRPLFQLIASFFMLCFLVSCEQETLLTIDETNIDFSDSGGSKSVTISSNKPWTITSDQAWCKAAPLSGEEANNNQITISCEQNTSYDTRFCNIVVSCAEIKKTISVSQAENYGLIISPTEYNISSEAQQVNIEVEANVKFSVSVEDDCKDWIQHSATKGIIANTVVLDITDNKTYDAREGRVIISQTDGTLFSTIKILQAQRDTVHIEDNKLTISSKGGLLEIPVASNFDYSIVVDDVAKSWISVVETKAIKQSTITLKVEPNEVEEPREGKIAVQNADGKVSSSFIVLQQAKNTLQASIHDYLTSSAGDIIGLSIISSIDYDVEISDSASWITQLHNESINSDSVYFHVAANLTDNTRYASIVFYNEDEDLSDTLKVEQYPANVSMPDEILYTSIDETIVIPYKTDAFNADIVSNTIINGIGSIRFNNSLETIGEKAFYNRLNLKSVVLPDEVVEIRESAFDNCIWLETIILPTSIKSIGTAIFKNCRSLVTVFLPSIVEGIPTEAFHGCSKLRSVILPTSLSGDIGTSAFKLCSSLTSIVIPKGVQTLGAYAFEDCLSLTSVTVPEGVESFSWGCFSGCANLKEVKLPSSLTTIGDEAFHSCSSLKEIQLPVGLTELGHGAFQNCSSLEKIEIPEGVSCIHASSFSSCVNLTSVKLSNQLTKLEIYAFDRTGLISITIPNSVVEIGDHAFEECKKLESVTLPNTLTYISQNLFEGCSALKAISIPECVATIQSGAFANSGLKTIILNDGLLSIDNSAFGGCKSLTTVKIPESVFFLGKEVFRDCFNLTNANIPKGINTISAGLFWGCKSLNSIDIPDSVERIEEWAFSGCISLTSVVIPEKVSFLGANVFHSSTGLKHATILPKTPPTCENNGAFYNTNECPIYVPKASVDSYKKAMFWNEWAHRIQAIP